MKNDLREASFFFNILWTNWVEWLFHLLMNIEQQNSLFFLSSSTAAPSSSSWDGRFIQSPMMIMIGKQLLSIWLRRVIIIIIIISINII